MKLILLPETLTSLQIANLVGSRHDKTKQSIDRLVERGVIPQPPLVDGKKSKNGVTQKHYALEERSAIIAVAQLSPEFTAQLVDEFKRLRDENALLKNKHLKRNEALIEYIAMQHALKISREEDGKDTLHFHYSNEADMINLIVLGYTSKAYKTLHGVDNVRDSLSALELSTISSLEKLNASLMDIGESFENRKHKLTAFFKKRFHKKFVEQIVIDHA